MITILLTAVVTLAAYLLFQALYPSKAAKLLKEFSEELVERGVRVEDLRSDIDELLAKGEEMPLAVRMRLHALRSLVESLQQLKG